MASSIFSHPTILFTFSILVLISTSISPVQCRNRNYAPSPTPTPPPPCVWIQQGCNSFSAQIDVGLCLRVLASIPKVASAEMFSCFLRAVVESGLSNSTKTREYMKALVSGGGDVAVEVLMKDCIAAYDKAVHYFEVGNKCFKHDDGMYCTPSNQMFDDAVDSVRLCDASLAKHNFNDEVIALGNKLVQIFAFVSTDMLD